MAKDWKGNGNSIYKTLGASNHTNEEREVDDFYATSPIAIDILVGYPHISLPKYIWEPSCGSGCLSKRLEQKGHVVTSTDLIDRGYGQGGGKLLRAVKNARRLYCYRNKSTLQIRYRIRSARSQAAVRRRYSMPIPENDIRRGKGTLLQNLRSSTATVRSSMLRAHTMCQECRFRLHASSRRLSGKLCLVDMAQRLQGCHNTRLD